MTPEEEQQEKQAGEKFLAQMVPMKDVMKLVNKLTQAACNFPDRQIMIKHPDGKIEICGWRASIVKTINEVTGLQLQIVPVEKGGGE